MGRWQRAWYEGAIWVWLLLPLTLLFWLLSTLRRLAYSSGLLSSHKIAVPIIVVGNISVGGNGKTPLVMRLCRWLKQQGYSPGVVSRGFGGRGGKYPTLVEAESSPDVVGDEPAFMKQHLNCPIVVDPVRRRGADALVNRYGCDVVISDDGLQHYALHRDIEIAVLDGLRRLGNGFLLPMGPLREGAWRLKTVDFVVVNGGIANNNEYLMSLVPGHLVNVMQPNVTKSISEFTRPVYAAAGIGNPNRFFQLLQSKGVVLTQTLVFPDHHRFKEGDLPDETLLMTEKDAIKCKGFAKENWWYLPVNASLSEQFRETLLGKLKEVSVLKAKALK